MKVIPKKEVTFTVELTEDEIRYIKTLTQNALIEEDEELRKIRMSLFVGCMRLLGYDIDDNGMIKR